MQYDRLAPSPSILWPCVAGVTFLALGFFAVRKDLATAIGLDKLIAFGRVFWAYFVALVAAALSIILMQYVRWSATLLGIMILLFVLMIHLPRGWLRDLAFAAGAWTLAGFPITLTRLCVAIPLMFFGVEHFLHPEFAPGVPLEKLTPDWVPVRAFFGYFTGVVLVVAGAAILVNKQAPQHGSACGLLYSLCSSSCPSWSWPKAREK